MTDPAWTHLAEHLPWLRGQAVHVAVQSAQDAMVPVLDAAGFTVAAAGFTEAEVGDSPRYRPIAEALRLPASTADNLDALADSLRDLPDRWPATNRLALLVSGADRFIRADLLGWTELTMVLRQATGLLWDGQRFVFETVFLVPPASYGADQPC